MEAEILTRLDQMQLMTVLFESIQYDGKREKKSCFQYMQELIDKIYGVEQQLENTINEGQALEGDHQDDGKGKSKKGQDRGGGGDDEESDGEREEE